MPLKIRTCLICSVTLGLLFGSCKKYLDASSNAKLTIPTTVGDFQSILDYSPIMVGNCAMAGETAADNYYFNDSIYNAQYQTQDQLAYLWKPGQFTGISPDDWDNEYAIVNNANVVLDGLASADRTVFNGASYDLCKGMALALRAKSFWEVAQIFTKGYDSGTADKDLGIVLRLTSNSNVASVRSTLAQTYQQIVSDLNAAIPLLPVAAPSFPYHLYKGSVYGLLARTYLSMGEYQQAGAAADSALSYNSALLDYNTITPSPYSFLPVEYTNPEDLFHTTAQYVNLDLLTNFAMIDSNLYRSYDANDLRKTLYFQPNPDGSYYYSGSYDGIAYYNGVATDEMYLIKAECEARAGLVSASLSDLNTLLSTRWVTGTYVPFTAPNATAALNLILTERRKELVFRMLRFTDIKRLNVEGGNISVTRVIGGQTYTLPPNDPRYAIQIPQNVIDITGIPQN
jgi:hypothetical protein